MLIGKKLVYGYFIGLLLCPGELTAQSIPRVGSFSTWREKKIAIDRNKPITPLLLDSLPVVAHTFSIEKVPTSSYRIDALASLLYWIQLPNLDSVTIRYRVFITDFFHPLQTLSFDSVSRHYHTPASANKISTTTGSSSWWGFSSIQAQGSLGRQIGFGNRQDAVVNSNFNLQLNGWLPDSIRIRAAISDQQLPLQPDGSTRQLQDFDQILLEFQKKGWRLQLGDIETRETSDYFLNFYKRLQGVSFSTLNSLNKGTSIQTTLSGAVTKGRYTRQQLDTKEGNQGPYRLQGPRAEFFLIVLANSERVYYDGVLLQRGEDQDYVINYNTAEIRFTPRRLVNKDSRIQVEFEYAEKNYLNSNVYVSEQVQLAKGWKFRLAAFQNTDAKNATLHQPLDVDQRSFLSSLGDSVQHAFYPSAVLDSGGKGKILYEKVVRGTDSFYRYSNNPAVPRYQLFFSDMGPGKGDYAFDPAVANGKVYLYLPPFNGVKQGRFEPVLLLETPKQQQVITASISYTQASGPYFVSEIATSNRDMNRLSSRDKGDDRGWAWHTLWKQPIGTQLEHRKSWLLSTEYERVQERFEPLERLRKIEFSRDWGLPFTLRPVTENLLRLGIQWTELKKGGWEYLFTKYDRSDQYHGTQQWLRHQESYKRWQFNDQVSYTRYSMPGISGSFWRPNVALSTPLPGRGDWEIGMGYQVENNSVRNIINKQLQPASFHFDQLSFFLQTQGQRTNSYQFRFYRRSDFYIHGNDWKKGDRSYNWQADTKLLKNASHQLELTATLRKLEVLDPQVSIQKNDWTLLSRLQYRLRKWKGMLQGNWLYELGTGQESTRDLVYIEVPSGQGEYAWNDYNHDGIQQLNEFELASFPDQAKFVRLFTPTPDFIKADQLTFSYHGDLNPQLYFGASHLQGWRAFLSKFSGTSSWQYNRRTISDGRLAWNPFEERWADTSLIALQGILFNTISFNRFSTQWGITLSNYMTTNKAVFTYGLEDRKQQEWLLKSRFNWNRKTSLLLDLKKGTMQLTTPRFANRNYQIEEVKIKPQIQWIQGTSLQVTGSFQFQERWNLPQWGGERSTAQVWMGEFRRSKAQQGSLTSRISLHQINYPHAMNSTISYVMLEGLVAGTNWVWTLSYQKRLLEKLELSIQYDGRKSGVSKTVHTGRAGITALF